MQECGPYVVMLGIRVAIAPEGCICWTISVWFWRWREGGLHRTASFRSVGVWLLCP